MSYIYKIVEKKNDGWFYSNEHKELNKNSGSGVYEHHLKLWDDCFLCLFNDSKFMNRWDKATTKEERKEIIWDCMRENVLSFLEEDLRDDLDVNIEIYPLIKKKAV